MVPTGHGNLTGWVGTRSRRTYAAVILSEVIEVVNKVILIGNLTADPEVRATQKGVYVANLRLATNTYTGKDEEGNRKEQTEYHTLVVFGKMAEFAGQYLRKGRLLYADGRLQTNSWEDSAGQKRKSTEVIVDTLTLLGPKPQEVAA